MASAGNIQSIKDGHSVKEAVVSFVVSPCISNPWSYKSTILEGGVLEGEFQRFEPVKNVSVSFNQQTEETTIQKSQDSGFKLLSFVDGEVAEMIQGINQLDKGLFIFNTLKYENWTSFWNKVKERANKMVGVDSDYLVKSYSLLYVDEFKTIVPEKFQLSQIFNLNSQYVPRIIADSTLMDYNLTCQKRTEEKVWAENILVRVDKVQNSISILNNISFAIHPALFLELLQDKSLDDSMQFAHDQNKSLLKDLLKTDIAKMIGLL